MRPSASALASALSCVLVGVPIPALDGDCKTKIARTEY
jgi:hypothetical protein